MATFTACVEVGRSGNSQVDLLDLLHRVSSTSESCGAGLWQVIVTVEADTGRFGYNYLTTDQFLNLWFRPNREIHFRCVVYPGSMDYILLDALSDDKVTLLVFADEKGRKYVTSDDQKCFYHFGEFTQLTNNWIRY